MTHTGTTRTAPVPLPSDLRRLLAFRAHGAARLLLGCRARLEDIEGAVAGGQPEVAVLMAYDLVQFSLSVRGLRTEGELSYGRDEAAFDPFAGVPAEDVEAGLLLAAEGAGATGPQESDGWSGCARTSTTPSDSWATASRCRTSVPRAA